MISIVIASHSAQLARSIHELADQMSRGRVPIAEAGGIDDPLNPFGTDAIRILEAIQSVYSDEGVLVFTDVGSAVLSAETALEFLPVERRVRVRLSHAPLVEGVLAAAAQAAAGGSLEEVEAEASRALSSKIAQITGPSAVPLARDGSTASSHEGSAALAIEQVVTVRTRLGLHARPAADFVRLAKRHSVEVQVRNLSRGSPWVNGKSITQLATLAISEGDQIAIRAAGEGARTSVDALVGLVERQGAGTEDRATRADSSDA